MAEDFGVSITQETQDNLIGGNHPPVMIPITLASEEGNLKRGHVLGRITASGKYGQYDNDASDGTETAVAILAEDADATSEDVKCNAYVHGEFKEEGLSWLDEENDKDAGILDLLNHGIYVK